MRRSAPVTITLRSVLAEFPQMRKESHPPLRVGRDLVGLGSEVSECVHVDPAGSNLRLQTIRHPVEFLGRKDRQAVIERRDERPLRQLRAEGRGKDESTFSSSVCSKLPTNRAIGVPPLGV